MGSIIEIKDLNFGYEQHPLFDHFNLKIAKGSFTTILGPNGSGKSTLFQILTGLLEADSYVEIAGLVLNDQNLKEIRQKLGIVFSHTEMQFVAETVLDDLAFSLENMGSPKSEIQKKIEEISKEFSIESLLEKSPERLTMAEKQIVALASALIHEPEVLLLDEALGELGVTSKKNIFELLKKRQKKGLTILNITQNVEESIFGDDILIVDEGKLIAKGKKELILKEEKIFTNLGLTLPFMASLSLKLQYYNLIDHLILDEGELVDLLWK